MGKTRGSVTVERVSVLVSLMLSIWPCELSKQEGSMALSIFLARNNVYNFEPMNKRLQLDFMQLPTIQFDQLYHTLQCMYLRESWPCIGLTDSWSS